MSTSKIQLIDHKPRWGMTVCVCVGARALVPYFIFLNHMTDLNEALYEIPLEGTSIQYF